ncbi:MAG: cysteine hydrolase family protein [Actinomycetota bacterium]
MAEKALIIIDMLNDFVAEGAPLKVPGIEKIIGPIKREIEKAKKAGFPVIYLCDSHEPEDREFGMFPPHAVKNTEGAKIIEELRPQGSDIIIKKTTFSGFYETNLQQVLQKMEVGHVVLAGCVTNICILYTAFEATVRGYDVDVVEDAVAGISEEDHQCALRQMREVLKANII